MADETSIKVSKATRARLGQLAAEKDTTIRALVESFAEATPTAEEAEVRMEYACAELADLGVTVTEEMKAGARRGEAFARLAAKLEKRDAA